MALIFKVGLNGSSDFNQLIALVFVCLLNDELGNVALEVKLDHVADTRLGWVTLKRFNAPAAEGRRSTDNTLGFRNQPWDVSVSRADVDSAIRFLVHDDGVNEVSSGNDRDFLGSLPNYKDLISNAVDQTALIISSIVVLSIGVIANDTEDLLG